MRTRTVPTLALLALAACAHPAPPAPPPAAAAPADDDATLVLDGTPEILPALRDRMRQYLSMRSAGLADLSADGRGMLVLTRFGETTQLHRVDAPLGARTQLTFRGEPVRDAEWTPQGDAILLRADEGGDEQYQVLRLDPSTGRTTRLTEPGTRNGGVLYSHQGDRLAFTSTARNGRDYDLWLSDGRSPDSRRLLTEVDGAWWPTGWAPGDAALLAIEYRSINESHVHLVDAETGEARRLTPEAPAASYRDAAFGQDAETLYVASDRGGEFVQLFRVDLGQADGGGAPAWTPLTADIPWDVGNLARSPDGRTVAFTTNEGGWSRLHLLDTADDSVETVEALPRGIVSRLDWSADSGTLGLSLGGPTNPGDAWTLDVASGAVTRWTRSEVGGLDPDRFVEPTLVHYESFDGREIPAFWYDAPGEGPHPVVVFIHGGPESQARPRFGSLTQYLLLESGFSVVVPNVRGSNGYGKSWLQLDNGPLREDSVKDIGALLDWIAAEPSLDADRVAVSGGSYGGYMVLASLVHYGDRIRAGVDAVGIANFVTFLENTKPYRQDLRRAEYGDERDPEMRALLERISPVHHADRIQSALFVAHGANDPRVPASEAEQIVSAVRAGGGDAWFMLARNEGHGFRKRTNRDTYRLLQVLFFEEHLGASPAPPESP